MANDKMRAYFGSQSSPVLRASLLSGSYYLSITPETTSYLQYNDSDATIQAAIEAMTGGIIGSGNVLVTTPTEADGFVMEFVGGLANTDVTLFGAFDVTFKQPASTVSVTTTTAGAADTYSTPTDGGGFTDGDGSSTAAVQTITFTPSPTQGSWTFNGSSYTFDQDISGSAPFGWSITGLPSSGGITITRGDNNSGQSPFTYSLDTLGYLSAAGTQQVVTVTLPGSPTEGNLNVTLGGVTSADFGYSDSAAAITGWTTGGGAGPPASWTYTRDTKASNVSVSGSQGSSALAKACGMEIVTVQEGSAGGGSTGAGLLLLGCG